MTASNRSDEFIVAISFETCQRTYGVIDSGGNVYGRFGMIGVS